MNIYLGTATYDQITKDVKATFESKLSAVGGTMGLLTGFSIISGVEIMYFGVKILAEVLQEHWKSIRKI